jgi:enoyl-CoA hydratase/carnithine racemase
MIVVTHGDTWNMAHELFLVADIRIASADTRFGQDENTHGRFPGGGSTVRFVREVGWGNAMRYMLTGDHWGAEEACRMGDVQQGRVLEVLHQFVAVIEKPTAVDWRAKIMGPGAILKPNHKVVTII